MKSIFITFLAAITFNTIINAHENHDHDIYNLPDSKNKTIQTDKIINSEGIVNQKNKSKTNFKNRLWNIFRKIN